ncbi:MAG: methylhydantoinase [Candidatus Nephthysia bennettiae]|nr:MAG: methylhydantoinase [Candidatus Dormibacteraeota bacterium]
MAESLDAFTLEIIKDKLAAAADEMGVVLARTSMSPIVYEVLDYACGVTDAQAQVVAQTNGLTLFTGTFGPQVQSVIKKFGLAGMRAGDVYMTNDPYQGGTHNCDVCLVAPVFHGGAVVGFAVSITHWIEIGGAVPGSIPPDATEIYQEGLQFPCLRLQRDGEMSAAIVDMIEANVRLPQLALGDLNAGTAAIRIGGQRMLEICDRYGAAALRQAGESILEQGERLALMELEKIPEGVYEAEDFIDGDGISEEPIPIRVRVTVRDLTLVADFEGCAAQARGPINCSWGALHSACKTVFRAITDPGARHNDGHFRPFRVLIPPGTVFSAQRPAPVGWYYEGSAFATEVLWKALASVVPERLGAGSYASLCASYLVGNDARTGGLFVLAEPNDGGWGASRELDGESGLIATTDGDTYNFPVEVAEARFPVVVERYELNTEDRGGAGRRRGGLGLVREYRVVDPAGAVGFGSMGGWQRRPWGLAGGQAGTNNYLEYVLGGRRERYGRVARVELACGDRVRIVTGSGGGYGDPREREPERVEADVRDGYVGVDEARDVYGIAVDPQSLAVDQDETARLRNQQPSVPS